MHALSLDLGAESREVVGVFTGDARKQLLSSARKNLKNTAWDIVLTVYDNEERLCRYLPAHCHDFVGLGLSSSCEGKEVRALPELSLRTLRSAGVHPLHNEVKKTANLFRVPKHINVSIPPQERAEPQRTVRQGPGEASKTDILLSPKCKKIRHRPPSNLLWRLWSPSARSKWPRRGRRRSGRGRGCGGCSRREDTGASTDG